LDKFPEIGRAFAEGECFAPEKGQTNTRNGCRFEKFSPGLHRRPFDLVLGFRIFDGVDPPITR
jgi:hypothetical protein